MPPRLLALLLVVGSGPTPTSLVERGDEALRDKRHAEAIARYDEAIASDPAMLPRTWGRGMALYGQGKLAAAAAAFERVIAVHPDHVRARYGRGLVAFRRGDLAGAEADLRAVLVVAPDDVRARYRLGQVLHAGGRLDDAVAVLRSVLERRWIHQPARYALAMALRDAGRLDEARTELGRFTRIEPLLPRIREAERRALANPADEAANARVVSLYGQAGRP